MDASGACRACRTVLQRDAVEWMEQLGPEGFPERSCALMPWQVVMQYSHGRYHP